MADKPKLEVVSDEELDEEEREFRSMRRDLPGVKGASAIGIVAIGVGKAPGKNEFFRTHREFGPTVPIIDHEEGMEKQFYACTEEMVEALASIGITVASHTLYLTVTLFGAAKSCPLVNLFMICPPVGWWLADHDQTLPLKQGHLMALGTQC
jgi:hypothetical protein